MSWSYNIQLQSHGPWWKQLEAAAAEWSACIEAPMQRWPYPTGYVAPEGCASSTTLKWLLQERLPELSAKYSHVIVILKFDIDSGMPGAGYAVFLGGKQLAFEVGDIDTESVDEESETDLFETSPDEGFALDEAEHPPEAYPIDEDDESSLTT